MKHGIEFKTLELFNTALSFSVAKNKELAKDASQVINGIVRPWIDHDMTYNYSRLYVYLTVFVMKPS